MVLSDKPKQICNKDDWNELGKKQVNTLGIK